MDIKYPNITVRLSGANGNAFGLIGLVLRELRRAGVGPKERDAFQHEARSSDYDHLLQTCMQWVNVE